MNDVDVKLNYIEKKIEETNDRASQNKNCITELKLKFNFLSQKIESNVNDLKELEKYKEVVNGLNSRMAVITNELKTIKQIVETKQKNTLVIAIAVLSPLITIILNKLFELLKI